MTLKLTKEDIILKVMPIISTAGMAKSLALEALREGNLEKLAEAKKHLQEAHKHHHELIILETQDDDNIIIEPNLIVLHSEDTYMSAETIISLVEVMINNYVRRDL